MRWALCLLLALSAACMRAPEQAPTVSTTPPAGAGAASGGSAAPPADDSGHQHAGNSPIHFGLPSDWKPSTREVMFASAVWDHPTGGGGTLSVVGGGVDANIQRWAGQFTVESGDPSSEMVIEELDGCTYPTKVATIQGTFQATKLVGGGPAREGWMMIGAAVTDYPDWEGRAIYLKLAGPTEVMEKDLEAIKEALRQLEYHG